jgi:hypothetical protein
MTILNFNKIYSSISDDTSGVIYCYTINNKGEKNTHRVLFAQDLSKVMGTLTIPSQRESRNIYYPDWHVKGENFVRSRKQKNVYVEVFPIENLPYHGSLLSRRMKLAIYEYQDSPIASYNRMARDKGWELMESIDDNNTAYKTEDNTITEDKPLTLKIPKFTIDDRVERMQEKMAALTLENVLLKEEQSKQATLLQQMFMLLSTWFATLGGVQKRT